jgi:hypothetical protein
MTDESVLRENAREVLQAGKLPSHRPDRMWGGPGSGADCPICRVRVTPDELEFEIEFVRSGDNASPDRYHLHLRCFSVWNAEREQLQGALTTLAGEGMMSSRGLGTTNR